MRNRWPFLIASPWRDDAPRVLDRQLATIVHRGPDGNGHYIDRETGRRPRPHPARDQRPRRGAPAAAFGRRPLRPHHQRRVLRLQAPPLDADGRGRPLPSPSPIPRSRSGSTANTGSTFTEHLRGEFAFALYDRQEDELILIRDRFGVRPLFYHLSPDRRHHRLRLRGQGGARPRRRCRPGSIRRPPCTSSCRRSLPA